MACEQPITAYRIGPEGPILFNRPKTGDAGIDYYKFSLPCGTCILCRSEQARQWAVRIHHEAQLTDNNCFITLTYSDQHLPPHGSLQYANLVKFWKRLRRSLDRQQRARLRYYAVGEYGDESLRPHYHACVFGHDFKGPDSRTLRSGTTPLWTSSALEKLWGLGQVAVGQLNFATARYTASYIVKKLNSKQTYRRIDTETGELIAVEQPRAFMSKNIGRDWWDRYRHYVTAHDHVIIDGKRQKPPKAYDRWLSERNEIAGAMLKEQRMKKAPLNSEEQIHARARNAHARAKLKKKSI